MNKYTDEDTPPFKLLIIVGVVIVGIILSILSFGKVDAGERGLIIRFGRPVRVVEPGFYAKFPFFETIKHISVRSATISTSDMTSSSKDLQEVSCKVITQFHYDPMKVKEIYTYFGFDQFNERIINPTIHESVKSAFSKFNAEELITKREDVRNEIHTNLNEALDKYCVRIDSLQIADLNFSERFNDAIEEKMVAEQEALKAKNVLERVKMEAQQKIEMANAEAESKVLLAKSEAESIRLQTDVIRENGGNQYIMLKAIEKWDGKVPTTLLGSSNGMNTLLNVK